MACRFVRIRPRKASDIDRRRHATRSAGLNLGRYNLVLFTGAATLALAAAIGLADAAGYESLDRVIGRFDPVWLPICLAGQLLAYLGYVLAVRDIARVDDGAVLSFSLTTRTVLAGFGVFAATHSAGGFAVDYWAMRRAGLKRDDAIARVLGLGALEYAVLAPAALFSAIVLLLDTRSHVQDAMTFPWLLVVPGFLAALWVSSPKRVERLSDAGDGGRIRHVFAHAVAGVWKLRCLAMNPLRNSAGLAGVGLYWFGDILSLWAALRVFNATISTPALILAYATGYILTRRSLPGGGAGIVEVLMTFALVWVGLPFAPALMGVLVYRGFNFWLPIVPALAVLPTVKQLHRDFRNTEAL
jgi:uncharacterized membrane protein YbhN (UPF0104 family)